MPDYARGGYISPAPTGSIPTMLSRGTVCMSLASYRALTPEARAELFPNTDIEIVLTADEARRLGSRALEELQKEIDDQ